MPARSESNSVPRSAGFISPVLAIAHNDLRLLFRDHLSCFFTFGFPVIFALLFGFIFGGGGGGGGSKMQVALVDLDNSEQSARFVADLAGDSALALSQPQTQAECEALVRTGKAVACVVVPKGFASQASNVFGGSPIQLETLVDPARRAEAGLLSGKLHEAAFGVLGRTFADTKQLTDALDKAQQSLSASQELSLAERAAFALFFATVKTSVQRLNDETANAQGASHAGTNADQAPSSGSPPAQPTNAASTSPLAGWKPIDISVRQLAAPVQAANGNKRPRSSFQVPYGQGVVWGLMGCVVAFITGLSAERAQGTLSRLLIAPIHPAQVLLGKAVACFFACMTVQALLLCAVYVASVLAEGGLFRVVNPLMLFVAAIASSLALTAMMMVLGTMVKSEAGGAGLGRAVLLVLAIVGGGTVPIFLMPSWMQTASGISPFYWSVLAIDGAVWRGFTLREFVLPLSILLALAVVGGVMGTMLMRRVRAA